MIVEELIQELQKYDPDTPVYLSKEGCSYSWLCTEVETGPSYDIDGNITLTGGG